MCLGDKLGHDKRQKEQNKEKCTRRSPVMNEGGYSNVRFYIIFV